MLLMVARRAYSVLSEEQGLERSIKPLTTALELRRHRQEGSRPPGWVAGRTFVRAASCVRRARPAACMPFARGRADLATEGLKPRARKQVGWLQGFSAQVVPVLVLIGSEDSTSTTPAP